MNRITFKVTTIGLTLALAVSATHALAEGKAAAAAAAIDPVAKIAETLWGELNKVDRGCVITINNKTRWELNNPKTYVSSGNIENLDETMKIPSGGGGALSVKKTKSGFRGAVGLVTYQIGTTDYRLAILYSIPYDRNLYKNEYSYWIVKNTVAIDKNLYKDLQRREERASSGNNAWHYGRFSIDGTMGTAGVCRMICNVSYK